MAFLAPLLDLELSLLLVMMLRIPNKDDLLFYWGGSQNLDTTKDVQPAPKNPIDPTNGIWSAKVTRKCHVPHYYHGPASQGISMSILAQTLRLG